MDIGPHIVWRAPEWLAAFGQLTRANVMEYFVLCPFFDKSSSNAQLRMQMIYSRGGMQGVDEESELTKFRGIEYVVAHAQEGLFVIHKRERTSPVDTRMLSVYYILNDNVYQSPSLYNVINERIFASEHALTQALDALTRIKPTWTPERHYQYRIKEPETDEPEARDEDDEHKPSAFNPLLFRALQATAASTTTA